MDGGGTAEERARTHGDVAGEEHGVREDHPIAERPVMGDMARGHQEAVAADRGRAVGLGGAIDRHVLPQDRPGADRDLARRCGIKGKVLRIAADHREGVHDDGLPENAVARDVGVGVDDAAGAERGARLDDRGRMNHEAQSPV